MNSDDPQENPPIVSAPVPAGVWEEPAVPDAPTLPGSGPRKSTRELLMSGMYSMGDRVSALVFGFGTLWMLTRLTSKEMFGVWIFFQGLTATFEVARSGLIQNALIRYLTTEDEREHGAIHGGAWILNVTLAVLGALMLYFGGNALESWLHFDGLGELTKIYASTFIAMTPLWQFNYVQQAHLEFRGAFWATIMRYLTMFSLVLLVFFGYFNVEASTVQLLVWLAYGQLAAATLGTLVSYAYAKPFLPAVLHFSKHWARKLFDFGRYVFGTNLSSMLYKQVDTAMLGALLGSAVGAAAGAGAAAAAVYGLAIRITNFVDVPTLAVASIVFPESSRVSEAEGTSAQARMYEKAVGAILAFVLPALLVVAIIPGILVDIVGGSQYADTIPVLQVTVLFSLFIPFANQFGTLLDASGNPKLNFVFTAAGMVLNVIVNYFFITSYGIIGAPLGTLTSYAVMFVAMQILLHRRYGVRLSGVARQLPRAYVTIFDFVAHKLGLRA